MNGAEVEEVLSIETERLRAELVEEAIRVWDNREGRGSILFPIFIKRFVYMRQVEIAESN